MRISFIWLRFAKWLTLPLAGMIFAGACAAQQPAAQQTSANNPTPAPQAQPGSEAGASPQKPAASKEPATGTHRFWDTQNRWLFAGVAAARTLDGTSTRNFRARGRDEGLLNNEIVDNAAAFAAIEFAATAASIGTSYWMHRTGHHKLERWVSYIHIGVGFFGDARNYALPSVHRPPTP